MKDIVLQSHFSMKNKARLSTFLESNIKIATTTPSSMTNFNMLSHDSSQVGIKKRV